MTDSLEDISATRTAYDATAGAYATWAGTEIGAATEGPLDRALLAAFAEMVSDAGGGRVADIGCGPGRVAAFIAAHGLDAVGVDLSPEMVAVARSAHPQIPFEEGRLTALPFADDSLAGAVCWYSIIHTPPEQLREVCAELGRVISPGGHLLVAFQAGDGQAVHRRDIGATPVHLTNYRHSPDDVASHLVAGGFRMRSRTIREPELSHEASPQAFLLAWAGESPGGVGSNV